MSDIKKRVGVVFGGNSVEHEISILSTMQASYAIDRSKYDVVYIYITKESRFFIGKDFDKLDTFKKDNIKHKEVTFYKYSKNQVALKSIKGKLNSQEKKPIDVILAIVHGVNVEDGSLAGYFNILEVPYTACDVTGAVLGQDKIIMKKILRSDNISVVPYTYYTRVEWENGRNKVLTKVRKIGYPVIVKPANLGSSIGIKIALDEEQFIEAVNYANRFDNRIIVEKKLTNFLELNCSGIKEGEEIITSSIEEVRSDNSFLTFLDKYQSKETASPLRIIPANIDEELEREVKEKTIKTMRSLIASGVCRIDFLYDLDNRKLYVNEINTIPGSLSFYLFEDMGIDFPKLINILINNAIKERYLKSLQITSFKSNVLFKTSSIKK